MEEEPPGETPHKENMLQIEWGPRRAMGVPRENGGGPRDPGHGVPLGSHPQGKTEEETLTDPTWGAPRQQPHAEEEEG